MFICRVQWAEPPDRCMGWELRACLQKVIAWTVSRVQHLSGVQPDGLSDGLGLVRGVGGVRRPFDVRIVYRIFGCSVGCLGGWSVGCVAVSVGCVAALSIRYVAEFVGWVYGWIVGWVCVWIFYRACG